MGIVFLVVLNLNVLGPVLYFVSTLLDCLLSECYEQNLVLLLELFVDQ